MFGITALYITYYGSHVISKCFKFCKNVKLEFANVAVEPVGAPVCVVFWHLRKNFLNMSDAARMGQMPKCANLWNKLFEWKVYSYAFPYSYI